MTTEPRPNFGDLLRRARRAAGLTHEQLAERSGLSVRGISDLERGIVRAPRQDTFDLLVDALGLSSEERRAWERFRRDLARRGIRTDQADRQTTHPPTTVVAPLTSFVGRDRDVAAVVSLLRNRKRHVTITGPGGVGKTRLAIAVGNAVDSDYPDGVWFVDLAPVIDARFVLSSIATTLGVVPKGSQQLADAVTGVIGSKRVLLIIDNFEHVIDATPSLIAILQACPGVSILLTSRIALRVSAEQEFPLAPLALPTEAEECHNIRIANSPAVRLFVERARAVRPDFSLTEGNVGAVVSICRQLDGLPLAIELAAVRVRAFPPPTLLRHLDQRFAILVTSMSDVPARQKTLCNTLKWSYDLLNPDEQCLFRDLGVFVGGWTLSEFEALTDRTCPQQGERTSTLSVLERLIDHSLVRVHDQPDGEPRYTMLETIRTYAIELLVTQDDEHAVRARHAGIMVRLAEDAAPALRGADEAVWATRLRDDLDNLRAALDWSIDNDVSVANRLGTALWLFWGLYGYVTEGRDWLERIIAASSMGATTSPELLSGIASLAYMDSDYAAAKSYGMAAVAAARAANDPTITGWGLHLLGRVAYETGDITIAEGHYQAALSLFRAEDDRRGIADMLNVLGVIAMDVRGDYDAARKVLTESLALRLEIGDGYGIYQSTSNLGWAAMSYGEYAKARRLFSESLRLAERRDDRVSVGNEFRHLGAVALREGDLTRAWDLLKRSITVLREQHDAKGIILCLIELTAVEAQQGNFVRAAQLSGAVEAMCGRLGYRLPAQVGMEHEHVEHDIRSHLTEDAWRTARVSGQTITDDDLFRDMHRWSASNITDGRQDA